MFIAILSKKYKFYNVNVTSQNHDIKINSKKEKLINVLIVWKTVIKAIIIWTDFPLSERQTYHENAHISNNWMLNIDWTSISFVNVKTLSTIQMNWK